MTKEARKYSGIQKVYLINGVEKIGQLHAKNETSPLSYMINKNKFKMD